ncbi:MAG: acyltransferase family protein [Siphonobacter sp.]
MERNYSIDTLRTIAAFLVIMLHVSAEYVNSGKTNLVFDASFWIGNIVDSFSRISVPVFVLISGMFLIDRKESFGEFYQKRAYRILIPLVSWSGIYLLYDLVLDTLINNRISFKSIIINALSGNPFYHMWYLFMIMGLYVITPIINIVIHVISKKILWIIAIILLIFGMINSTFGIVVRKNDLFIFWFLNYLGYFIFGYLIKNDNNKFLLIALLSVYIVSGFVIAILSYYTIVYFNNLYFYTFVSPFVAIGSLSIVRLFNQLKLGDNLFSRLSCLTLGIYLIHAGVLDILVRLLRYLDIYDHAAIGIPLKFIITSFVSIRIATFIKKTKYIHRII